MSDETPVPETLETIATSIRDLRKSMDSRFDELKAQLRTEIESVRGDVRLVAGAFGAQTTRLERHARTDKTFKKRLDGHDTRILALERKSLP